MHPSGTQPLPAMRRSLDAFFSESSRKYPGKPALFANGEHWSYEQLDSSCRRIERTLVGAKLADSQRSVGLIYGRSAFSYAAVIAIMRSNCVYVPLNVAMSADRIRRIVQDAAIELLIVDLSSETPAGVLDLLCEMEGTGIVVESAERMVQFASRLKGCDNRMKYVNDACTESEADPAAGCYENQPPAGLAYIIYTSGSTGIPKGVPITHESACRCIDRVQQLAQTGADDRFTEFSALSFDVSIADLFLCWKSGGTLYVPSASELIVPNKFAVSHGITVWSSVPSLANFLFKLQLLRPDALPELRLTLFCGEVLPAELAQAWASAAPRSRIFNIYGPTECTIFFTYHEYQRNGVLSAGVVPIGQPMPGLDCMIVDNGSIVDGDAEPGELWLSGDQLAAGYWNNREATEAAFVAFPYDDAHAKVWYRTGDLVSRERGADLIFRGRLDRQIKLRGFRIELQEVESVLREVTGCALAAVVPLRNAGGMYEKIVAFCDRVTLGEGPIKALCATKLASYAIPERIYQLDSFPVNGHGKIDYRELAVRATSCA